MLKSMKTIKELFPEMTQLERCRLGELASKNGIKRIGDKIKENGHYVCLYNIKDHEKLKKLSTKKKRKRVSKQPIKITY